MIISYIDCFKHKHIGYFCQLPVYELQEDIPDDRLLFTDFIAKKHQLIVGGGSGEHSALIIRDPDACVASFFRYSGNSEETFEFERYWWLVLDYWLWSLPEYTCFYKYIRKYSSFKNLSINSVEEWIMIVFGEFIYYSKPYLIQDSSLRDVIENKLHHTPFIEIATIPTGYPNYHNF